MMTCDDDAERTRASCGAYGYGFGARKGVSMVISGRSGMGRIGGLMVRGADKADKAQSEGQRGDGRGVVLAMGARA